MKSDKLTALVIGDPHFKVRNGKETDLMTQEIINVVHDRDPDFVVVLGDILDRHETIHEAPLRRSTSMLWQLAQEKPLYIIIGNHDRPNNSVYLTDQHPFNAFKHWENTTVVDVVMQDTIGGHLFTFIPFVPPGRFMEALETINVDKKESWKQSTCIFAHQEFKGAKMGAIISEEGDEWPPDLPLVVSGHIHDYDHLQNNIIYTGTPIQHAFGDRSDKTISLFTFESLPGPLSDPSGPLSDPSGSPSGPPCGPPYGPPYGRWHEERIDLKLPKKIILRISFKDIDSTIIPPETEVKIIISGNTSEIKTASKLATIKNWVKEGAKVVYRDVSEISFQEDKIGVTLKFEEVMVQMLEKLPIEEQEPLKKLFHHVCTSF